MSPRTPEQDALAAELVEQHCYLNGNHVMGKRKAAAILRTKTGLALDACRIAVNLASEEFFA